MQSYVYDHDCQSIERIKAVEEMHAAHEILVASNGKDHVPSGEIITSKVDIAGINDVYIVPELFIDCLSEERA